MSRPTKNKVISMKSSLACGLMASAGLVALAAPFNTFAQPQAPQEAQQGGALVQQILVRGNQRIEADTVKSYLPVRPGERINQVTLDTSLKALFATGLFADANIVYEGGGLLVEVKENPIVNRVLYDGNKRTKDDKLTEEVELTARAVYTKAKVQADVQRIIEVYRRAGRFAATVTPKIVPLDQNRVDVVFEIDEGPITGIAKINFEGNEAYNSTDLRKVVLTAESRWWNFFESNDNYDPDRTEYDRELLRQHYTKNGYADFQVLSAVAELTPDRKDFFINFQLDEGVKYNFGKVSVKSSLSKIDPRFLERVLPIREGQLFNSEKIEKATESITYATGISGYAFVDVNPRLSRNPENQTVDITFEVNEGPRVYVERINIHGNTTTLDRVIRREMRLVEGDAFNRVLVDRSTNRLRSLQYFGDVKIEEVAGSAPDRTVLDVGVTEQSTGSFSVGVGVSSTDNFIANFSIEQRNLLGKGQFLQLDVRASDRTNSAQIRFREPYLFGRNLLGGLDLFYSETDFEEAGFLRESFGVTANVGFPVSEIGRLNFNYTLRQDVVLNDFGNSVEIGAPGDILEIPSANILFEGEVPVQTFEPIIVDENGTITIGDDPATFVDEATALANPDSFIQRLEADACQLITSVVNPSCETEGEFITSALGYTLTFDARNDPITPSGGWRAAISQSFAGLGGDVETIRTEVNGAYHKRLPFNLIGSLKANLGYVDSWGDENVRLSDRFFRGASTFRGFEVAGVGPRYLDTNAANVQINNNNRGIGQAIGGKAYAVGTVEVLLPLPLPPSYGIKASLFTDFGSVGIVDDDVRILNEFKQEDSLISTTELNFNPNGCFADFNNDNECDNRIEDDFSLRASAGLSIQWRSPFGPVQIDIADAFLKEEYDDVEEFRFSAGGQF